MFGTRGCFGRAINQFLEDVNDGVILSREEVNAWVLVHDGADEDSGLFIV